MPNLALQYSIKTELSCNDQTYDMGPVIQLLKAIQKHDNLHTAAKSCHFSYRKSWDILKQFKLLFGSDLVNKKQGRGSQLTILGEIIVNSSEINNQQFDKHLTSAANKTNTLIQAEISSTQLIKIIASDSEKLNNLRQQHRSIKIQFEGSLLALRAYQQGQCEIAGFHISAKNNRQQLSAYCQLLDENNDHFLLLEKRSQGIISHPKQPIYSLQQIIDEQLLFVNRQEGSGTRQLIDFLLNEAKIAPDTLNGYFHEEHTHLAIASMILSGQASAGIGIQSAAEHLNLHFYPLCSEYYFLVFKTISPAIKQILMPLFNEKIPQPLDYNNFINFFKSI